jgi:hypothetical protein
MGKDSNKPDKPGNPKNAPRGPMNNFNPYNKIRLNQFHQQTQANTSEGKQLRKKQRDLERLLNYEKIDEKVKE